MLSTFKPLDIHFSDLLLRWLQAFIPFKEFHGMFNCLLNLNDIKISSPHQKYSSDAMTTKHTHTMTTVMRLVH